MTPTFDSDIQLNLNVHRVFPMKFQYYYLDDPL